jgi:hypothetical protein
MLLFSWEKKYNFKVAVLNISLFSEDEHSPLEGLFAAIFQQESLDFYSIYILLYFIQIRRWSYKSRNNLLIWALMVEDT